MWSFRRKSICVVVGERGWMEWLISYVEGDTMIGLVWYNNMTKESVYIRKELNSLRIGLVHQHDRWKCLHKKRVELPQDWFGSTTWPPLDCFGTTIWLPWRHVHTLFNWPFPSSLLPLFQNESKCEKEFCISFAFMQIKVIFLRIVSHVNSLWKRGTTELGNGRLFHAMGW